MNNKVFFIGLGLGGCRIVRDLKKLGYEGIMLDCSNNNRKALEIENGKRSLDDYYTMGIGGTCGKRSDGRAFIEKDIWQIQRKLLCLRNMEYVVMISCANSGVSGGEDILIQEVKENYPTCKIGLINILPTDYYIKTLEQIINASEVNDIIKIQGKIENHIYIYNDNVLDIMELNNGVVNEVNE